MAATNPAVSAVASRALKQVPSIRRRLEAYAAQQMRVPNTGKHICAYQDPTAGTVVVYQAFNAAIAEYATKHQRFVGCPEYSLGRMTWFKTNFMWMMYRCGWAAKDKNQERVLAIHLTADGFDEMLRRAVGSETGGASTRADDVRLQWDPDHFPDGSKHTRRAVQIGVRGDAQACFHSDWIVMVEDITASLVAPQRAVAMGSDREAWGTLEVPEERVYIPTDAAVAAHVGLEPA